jgi:hypothetical protein
MTGYTFLEPEEFCDLRTELVALRRKLEMGDAASGPITLPLSQEDMEIRHLQWLLLHFRNENARAKMILDELAAHNKSTRSISVLSGDRDLRLGDLTIELFEGYSEIVD